jgi:hypothetical protein
VSNIDNPRQKKVRPSSCPAQFESPLVLILILIFTAAISLVPQQWVNSAIILVIVLGSTLAARDAAVPPSVPT